MRLAWITGFLLAVAACDGELEHPDAGSAPPPPFDASVASDAGSRADVPALVDAAVGEDAGGPPCTPQCDEEEHCVEQRCVRSCPCAEGERCDRSNDFCRPTHCASDSLCPPESVCLQGRCARIANPCSTDAQCGVDQHCSQARQCTSDECIAHSDCQALERCAQGRCLPRVFADPRILFERVREPHLEAHFSSLPGDKDDHHEETAGELGYGAALFDFDGDLDLDIFIGSQTQDQGTGVPACLYRNDSLPGSLRFTPVDTYCQWRETTIHGAFALDLGGDGFHEVLLAGNGTLILQRFRPRPSQVDLLDLLPIGDPRRSCLPASAVGVDLNYDGRLDLYVGCQLSSVDIEENALFNIVFYQNIRRDFVPELNPASHPLLLETEGSTLALGAADLDEDGLVELMVCQDSIPVPDQWVVHPGGIYKRCSPLDDCDFESYPLGQGAAAFRHLMGSGVLQIENSGEFVYFSDVDINQLIQVNDQPAQNRSAEFGVSLARQGGEVELFSWGVVVDDFDRDGFDDLFVSRGSVIPHPAYDFSEHWDALLLQRPGELFATHSDDVGITPFSTDDTGHETYVYSSRAALKADLDYDGHLDILGMGMEGAPRLHREVPLRPLIDDRCTLVPMPRYAPGFGTGHQLIPPGGAARKWDSQGQLRSSASPFILSPWQQGRLRFPSGATLDFDCQGRIGPVVLVEPDWLTLEYDDNTLIIETGAARPEGILSVLYRPDGALLEVEDLGDGRARVSLPAGASGVMLRFGSRWLPRWFGI
jgi:hypothetical protein